MSLLHIPLSYAVYIEGSLSVTFDGVDAWRLCKGQYPTRGQRVYGIFLEVKEEGNVDVRDTFMEDGQIWR